MAHRRSVWQLLKWGAALLLLAALPGWLGRSPWALPTAAQFSPSGQLLSGPDQAAVQASTAEWTTLRFDWSCHDGRSSAWVELCLDRQTYDHYRRAERIRGTENFYQYVNEAGNQVVIRNLVDAFRDVAESLDYSDDDIVREMVIFVQDCIDYAYDSDTTGLEEYPRYPVETLYEGRGDCEDTSILLAALLKQWGYEVGLLHLPQHVAVAIRTADDYQDGPYYELNGRRYLYIETTGSNWAIGDIPEDLLPASACLYLIP